MYLYKYRGGDAEIFKRDLEALVNNKYWSAKVSTLNDPCEALIDSTEFFESFDSFKSIVQNIDNTIDVEIARQKTLGILEKVLTVGVFSLSKTYEDELMWSHYAAAHHGFCISYDMYFIKRSLDRFFKLLIEVDYVDSPSVLNFVNQFPKRDNTLGLTQLIGTKSKQWANENEVRIVTDKPGYHNYDFRSINAIYFGLRMPESQKKEMMWNLRGRGIRYYQMEMQKHAYQFKATEVTDDYANEKRYMYNISPITAFAVELEHVPSKFKKYSEYLFMAVEVARREPYCTEVIMSGFTSNCTVDNPIIFVHCVRIDINYSNYEYSLDEINHFYNQIDDL